MEEKIRIYSDKKYYDENFRSSEKSGRWLYSFKYFGQKAYWARTDESPAEYNIRMNPKENKDKGITIVYKGEKYSEKNLDEIYTKLCENYIPKNNNEEDLSFKPMEGLTEDKINEIKDWRTRMNASSWKSRQRSLRKKGKLEQYKIDALNKLGMLWNPKEDLWEKNYLIYRKFGFCSEIEDWVKEQRERFKGDLMSKDNLYRLERINFPFKAKQNEEFPITYNTLYELQEKLRKKKRRIELKLINKPPKKLTKGEREIVNKEKESKKNKEHQKALNSFYTKLYMINGKIESSIKKLDIEEVKKVIYKIEAGHSIYFEAKKEHLDNVMKNKALGYYTRSFVKPFYDKIRSNISTNEKYSEISVFNSSGVDIEVRKYACNILLTYFKVIFQSKMKNFKPLDYLISCYRKEKDVDELIKTKKYVAQFPLLFELYDDKIEQILIKY
jgi:hypothetical protein